MSEIDLQANGRPVYVITDRSTGDILRGLLLDPQIHGFDGFEFDASKHSVVRYEPRRKAVPVPAIQEVEGRIRSHANRIKDPKDRRFVVAIADAIDKLTLEYGK